MSESVPEIQLPPQSVAEERKFKKFIINLEGESDDDSGDEFCCESDDESEDSDYESPPPQPTHSSRHGASDPNFPYNWKYTMFERAKRQVERLAAHAERLAAWEKKHGKNSKWNQRQSDQTPGVSAPSNEGKSREDFKKWIDVEIITQSAPEDVPIENPEKTVVHLPPFVCETGVIYLVTKEGDMKGKTEVMVF
ncbi:hypothetical protein K469DRAFT_691576 [Zopfia rhizophila CBS 207.26]|uniref:Uncharacterized protein n=1 Tax=Zopfia rhizophila CBS 207.26 TaxID=1314779 RepID=A0A6A6DUQ2_9PEZI|nr:hypothetical protein K469DRAFT_691576 [Zopfia rhizophila CBS 207.26]